jgi:hypothetical protein
VTTAGCTDVYERVDETYTLLSTGPSGGNGANAANFAAVSQNGSRVFFTTRESLVSADTDTSVDVYERSGGTTTLLSIGPAGGNGTRMAILDAITPDGSKVFFHTSESLVSADTDSATDVYERSGGTTTLISTGPVGGNGANTATFKRASLDGSRVFFQTTEKLTSDDTDGQADVYQRSSGTTTRLSFGPTGGNGDAGASEFFDALFVGSSDDGTRVFFETDEALVSTDVDVNYDVYERTGSTTNLLSVGPAGGNAEIDAGFAGASADGTRVFVQTTESLVASDTDGGFQDVYERTGASTALISTGPNDTGGFDASFAGASQTGTRVFVSTPIALVSGDTDGGWRDIYERSGSTTTLLSTGTADPHGPVNAFIAGSQPDGSRVFFHTTDPLVTSDTDDCDAQTPGNQGCQDVYERTAGATALLSSGPAGGNGPFGAAYAGTSTDGNRVFIHTGESLVSQDLDGAQDVYAAIVNVLFPRPGGGTPLRAPLVPAYRQCTTATQDSNHIAPLNLDSCSAPAMESDLLTTGTAGRLNGSARLDVIVGTPSTPADEADVRVTASMTDVRNASDGTDYVGPVIVTTSLRITDRANGYSQGLSGTAADGELSLPVDCVATVETNVGSTCSVNTTVDTLVPNFAREGKRAVISTLGILVEDAGADGDVAPPVNPLGLACPPLCGSGDEKLFLRQGVFLP